MRSELHEWSRMGSNLRNERLVPSILTSKTERRRNWPLRGFRQKDRCGKGWKASPKKTRGSRSMTKIGKKANKRLSKKDGGVDEKTEKNRLH